MTTPETAPEVTQADRDAAKALLDRLHIREHETGSFRSWDETVEAFARHRLTPRQDGLREALAHEERKAVLQNKRVNDAIQTALERGELTITGNGYLAALSTSPLTGALREKTRIALYEGLGWFGTLPEPEGDVPERYHRWDDLGEFADRILAALSPDDGEV